MKFIVSTYLFLFVFINTTFSQNLDELQTLIENLRLNTVYIAQIGNYNMAEVIQERTIQGASNYIVLNQIGDSHNTKMDIKGNDNGISINQKKQNSNLLIGNNYISYIRGNNNFLEINQTGHLNKIEQTIKIDGIKMEINQSGYKNEINLVNDIPTSFPVMIEQNGHNMKLIIENNIVVPK